MIESKQLPHLLFHGPPGTGKTTTILACCRLLYGGHGHTDRVPPNLVLELNASDDRGISVVREEIKNFSATRNIFGGSFKLVILDEADHLTSESQAALRRVIEKYTRNVRFCLICNYVNKIIPAIQSRCARFRFGPLEDSDVVIQRLKEIADAEEMEIDMDALHAVYDLSEGDMRKCVNILQSLCLVHQKGHISFEDVYRVNGRLLPREVEQIVGISMEKPLREAIQEISEMTIRRGIAVQDLLKVCHHRLYFITTVCISVNTWENPDIHARSM
jgi:replication factor C subunit 3/5